MTQILGERLLQRKIILEEVPVRKNLRTGLMNYNSI